VPASLQRFAATYGLAMHRNTSGPTGPDSPTRATAANAAAQVTLAFTLQPERVRGHRRGPCRNARKPRHGAKLDTARDGLRAHPSRARGRLQTARQLGAAALLILSATLLAACGGGISEDEMAGLQSQIQTEFKKKNESVRTFALSKDDRYQVSGMIYVDAETVMGVRTYYSTCLATMEPQSRQFTWHCDAVP